MIRMSFSSKNLYDTCPAWFEFKYIKKVTAFEDPRHTFLGNVLDLYFDWFYRYKLYESDWMARLENDLSLAINACSDKLLDGGYEEFISETTRKCLDLIPKDISALKKYGLVAPRVDTQYDLELIYDHPKRAFPIHFLGMADFIYFHNNQDIRIFDGKASKYRHKNVHVEQLKLYALLFYLKHHKIVAQMGFIYWSFPHNPIDYIYLESDDFRSMLDSCYAVAEKIMDREFNPKPAGHCYICPYASQCKSGQEQRKRSKKNLIVVGDDFMLEDFNGI